MISPDSSRRSGFTLIELLASVGVIAVLSALLFPAVAKARSRAEAGQCMSNLRQLHMAYMQEATDNDMTLPWSYYTEESTSWTEKYASSQGGDWKLADGGEKLASSTGCPAHRRKLKLGYNRRTYAINSPLTDSGSLAMKGRDKSIAPKLSQFPYPSKTLLLADGPIKSATSTQNVCNSSDKMPDCHHDKRANAAFLDGHVESLTQEQWTAMKGSLPNSVDNAGTPISIFWYGM
jgi:prepilin-type N-terminal cleavage/methylation domain-containing protein/prepilin-type processing-associated H-X9-DG protein